ncbi:GntR family transcriptional regulator [Novosphingobium sp. ST904]|nr:GntR family transcriptional regulator [Novosphingobium sp. ST904]
MTTRPAAPGLRESIDRHIIARITSGEWSAGDRIPSESGFMEMFGAAG